jgi:acetolactate synthase-1/2/3 large subunit
MSIAGPGSLNMMNGIAQAYSNSSPLIHISGDFNTNDRILSYHGVDDFDFTLKMFEPITKWSVRIKSTEDIPKVLSRAFSISKNGRPGPVHIQIPPDVLNSKKNISNYRKREIIRSYANRNSIDQLFEFIRNSKQILIYAGIGVARSNAFTELIELSEKINSPIGTTRPASDIVPFDYPLYIGNSHQINPNITNIFHKIMEDCDTIIVIGTGLGGHFTKPLKEFEAVIHIDFDEKLDYDRVIKIEPTIQVLGDIKYILKKLLNKINTYNNKNTELINKIDYLKKRQKKDLDNLIKNVNNKIHPYKVLNELRKILKKDDIITSDVGSSCRWLSRFESYYPNTVLISGRWDSMGTGLATSLGAKLLNPNKNVINVSGDHGFLMAPMEIGTAVKYELNIVNIIFNNDVSGSIWRHQQRRFPNRTYSTELFCPDFVKYAESFGAKGINVDDPREIENAINKSLYSNLPYIISIDTDYKWSGLDFKL